MSVAALFLLTGTLLLGSAVIVLVLIRGERPGRSHCLGGRPRTLRATGRTAAKSVVDPDEPRPADPAEFHDHAGPAAGRERAAGPVQRAAPLHRGDPSQRPEPARADQRHPGSVGRGVWPGRPRRRGREPDRPGPRRRQHLPAGGTTQGDSAARELSLGRPARVGSRARRRAVRPRPPAPGDSAPGPARHRRNPERLRRDDADERKTIRRRPGSAFTTPARGSRTPPAAP